MISELVTVQTGARSAYVVAALLFIFALAGLSRHETARLGNRFGMSGMVVASVSTLALAVDGGISNGALAMLALAAAAGAAIGLWRARVVAMTGMPELIALLHSFVGLAAVLVGWNGFLQVEGAGASTERTALDADGLLGIHSAEVVIGVFIGAITLSGSVMAFLKLSARVRSAALVLPGKNLLNLAGVATFVVLTAWFVVDPQLWLLAVVTALALALAGTWWPPSAGETCRWWSRCSTPTPDGPPQPRDSSSTTTCSSSPERSWGPRVRTCPTSCAPR